MSDLHSLVRWPLYTLVVLHVLAACSYWLLKGEDRIRPIFVDGRLALKQARRFQFAPVRRALLLLLISMILTSFIIWFGPVA